MSKSIKGPCDNFKMPIVFLTLIWKDKKYFKSKS